MSEAARQALQWIDEQNAPTGRRRYHHGKVCASRWLGHSPEGGDEEPERHSVPCWVPLLRSVLADVEPSGTETIRLLRRIAKATDAIEQRTPDNT